MLSEVEVSRVLESALRVAQPFRPCRSDVIYVTEAVQPCVRRAYFERLHPQPPSVASVVGEYLHALLEEGLRALGLRTEVGVALNLGDFRLVGRADAVAEGEDGDVLDVVEIKTVGRLPEEPLETHVAQLQVYVELLGAPRGTLIYIGRNTGAVKLFTVRPDRAALELAIINAMALWAALESRSPPPPRRGAWCAICPHRRRCRLIGLGTD